MRALIRNTEVMPEDTWSEWVRNNLAFLTGTERDSEGQLMKGDGWVIVTDYNPELTPEENVAIEDEPYLHLAREPDYVDEVLDEMKAEETAEPLDEEETVTIKGKTYTLSELKTLLH